MAKHNLISKEFLNKPMDNHVPFAIIISAPSGTGKTTVIQRLVKEVPFIKSSVSTTTRHPRQGEVEGKDYFFLNQASFHSKIQNEFFLEYDIIYDNFYGTAKSQVLEHLNSGYDVIFDINWHGASQIKSKVDSVLIYLLPPSLSSLHTRLLLRAKDSIEVIDKRLLKAQEEILYASHYDYIIVNEDLEQTISDLKTIIRSERIKRDKKQNLIKHLKEESITQLK
jgi:guanylate kinase